MEERRTEEVRMPSLGYGMTGTIGRWHKHEGEAVRKGEVVVEIETEKVTIAVDSPTSGILRQRLAETGSTAPASGVLALVEPGAETPLPAPVPAPKLTRKERTALIVRISLRVLELLLLIVGLFFLAIRMYQIGFIFFLIGSARSISLYLYRVSAAFTAWLKRRRP